MYRATLLARRAMTLNGTYPAGTECQWWRDRRKMDTHEGERGIINCWGTSLDGHQLGVWIKGVGFVPFECVRVLLTRAEKTASDQ